MTFSDRSPVIANLDASILGALPVQAMWTFLVPYLSGSMSFGEGSSPALFDDRIVLVHDHEGPSSITVLDKRTGGIVWKVDRDEGSTWSTPLVVRHDGKAQVGMGQAGQQARPRLALLDRVAQQPDDHHLA